MPFGHFHDGALSWGRGNLKFVDESANAGESEAQAAGGGETVAESEANVANAGAIVGRDNENALAAGLTESLQGDLPFFCVGDDITREFGNGGSDEGSIDRRETNLRGQYSALVASEDDVLI